MQKLWVRLSLTNAVISVLVVMVLVIAIFSFRFIEFTATDGSRLDLPPRPQGPPAVQGPPAIQRPPQRGPAEWPLFLGIMIGAVAVGVLSGVVASRTISNPISKLARLTQQLGARNLSARAPVEGSEEIATLAQSFNDMAGRLQASDEHRARMLADISHELRTPLTVLKGHLRAQLDGVYALNEADTANLYGQVEHLIRLVEDLRLLTQAESRQIKLNVQPAHLKPLAQACVELFAPSAEEGHVRLGMGAFPDGMRANMDSARVRQVLTNLIANALRHTHAGGSISIAAHSEASHVRISVTDTGEGIPAEGVPYVFDRFYRADGSRNRDTGGTGLGLSIVKAIVEAQGGTVGVHSAVGQGSVFWFTVPLAN